MATKEWLENNQDKMREYRRNWYYRNRESQLEKQSERNKAYREWFRSIKEGLSCEECGQDHPACIEFHHVNPEDKDDAIASMISDGRARKDVLKEIEKCRVLCSNCHKILHYNERADVAQW